MVKSGARDKARRRWALAIDRKLPVRRRDTHSWPGVAWPCKGYPTG